MVILLSIIRQDVFSSFNIRNTRNFYQLSAGHKPKEKMQCSRREELNYTLEEKEISVFER